MSLRNALPSLFFVVASNGAPCAPLSTNVIYINGIQNTVEAATKSRNSILGVLDKSANHTGPSKRAFSVSLLWNPIGWYGIMPGSLPQDLKELFLLKTAEEDYRSDFQKIVAPFDRPRTFDDQA